MAWGDLDNDGDLDLVFNNLNEPASIYENQSSNNQNFVRFIPKKDENTIDFGAVVKLHSSGSMTSHPILTSRGYLSASQPVAHFGLEPKAKIDSVTIHWSNGTGSVHQGFGASRTYIIQKDGESLIKQTSSATFFTQLESDKTGLSFKHQENSLDDFSVEKLLPHAMSRLGPGIAIGDVTENLAKGLSESGMISSALWTDFDQDGDMDLIAVGEWTEILMFTNNGGTLVNSTAESGLAGKYGWWNSITGGDFDDDGDMDYVVGNLGLNNKFGVTNATPLQVHYNDFDGDSKGDIVLSYITDSTVVPVRGRVCSSAQMPNLKEQFGSSRAFGESNLFQIYDNDRLKESLKYQANEFRSMHIENLGNGNFEFHALPAEAQLGPVYGLVVNDFTGNGNLDILMTGNNSSVEVETGNYDALKGVLLEGNGSGGFSYIPNALGGFRVSGDGKALGQILNPGESGALVVATQNNGHLLAFKNPLNNSTNVRLPAGVTHGYINLKNGEGRYFELYNGSGYLSSSSHCITVPLDAISIDHYNSLNTKSTLVLSE